MCAKSGTGQFRNWSDAAKWLAGLQAHLSLCSLIGEGCKMRKPMFFGFIAFGGLAGLFSAAMHGWGTRVIMACIGMLFGAAIGGALARIGGRTRPSKRDADPIPGMGVTSEDLAANYWRDKGHPPFMKPPDSDVNPNASGTHDHLG